MSNVADYPAAFADRDARTLYNVAQLCDLARLRFSWCGDSSSERHRVHNWLYRALKRKFGDASPDGLVDDQHAWFGWRINALLQAPVHVSKQKRASYQKRARLELARLAEADEASSAGTDEGVTEVSVVPDLGVVAAPAPTALPGSLSSDSTVVKDVSPVAVPADEAFRQVSGSEVSVEVVDSQPVSSRSGLFLRVASPRFFLVLSLILVVCVSVYAFWHRDKRLASFDSDKVLACFSWQRDGVFLYDDQVIEVGDAVGDHGQLQGIERDHFICSKDKVFFNKVMIVGSYQQPTRAESAKIYNIRLSALVPLFEHWGFSCDFAGDHLITMLAPADGPEEVIDLLVERGAISRRDNFLYNSGPDDGFIFARPTLWRMGTKTELLNRYQYHVPYQIDIEFEESGEIFVIPPLDPREALKQW